MYVINGIAYAGEPKKPVSISAIRALDNHVLMVRFNTAETKMFDFSALLDAPAFQPLKDIDVFEDVSIEHGVPMWCSGDIDISPEYLYEHGSLCPE